MAGAIEIHIRVDFGQRDSESCKMIMIMNHSNKLYNFIWILIFKMKWNLVDGGVVGLWKR